MPYNPVHYRKTSPAIGNTTDQMATTVVGPESVISLLKGIYASLGGGVPLPDGSVGLEKLQFIEGHRVLGRAKSFSGFVEQITFNASRFDWTVNPGPGGVDELDLKKLSITTDYIADSTIINQKVVDHSIDLRTKMAGVTPNRLFGSDPGGLMEMVMAGPGLRLRVPDVPPLVIEIGPSYITEDFIAGGAIIDPHIADRQIKNRHIIDNSIDIVAKALPTTANRLFGTNASGSWRTVSVGTGLVYDSTNGILASTSGAGTGSVNPVPPVNNQQLARFADGTGTLIKGVDVPPSGGITLGPATIGITAGGITGSMIGAGQVLNGNIADGTIDLTTKSFSGPENRLLGTFTTTGHVGWITIGAGLNLALGVLTGSGVVTSGAVSSSMLTGYADSTGATLRGINLPTEGIGLVGANLTLKNDLASLEAATVNGAIYYRSAADTWSTVNVTQGLTFAGGTLGIVHPALVSIMNTPGAQIAADKVPYYTSSVGGTAQSTFTATAFARGLMANADAATYLAGIGAQPLDADLTSLAGAIAVNALYYRSAADTWSTVTIGTNLTFTGGTLSATGTGSVNTGGAVTSAQLAGFSDSTGNLIQGITLPPAGFTRSGAALILTNDLAALEGANLTNTIYYRSAADTWSAVVIGSGLTFTGGTLTATASSGGDVLKGSYNAFTAVNSFSNFTVLGITSAAPPAGPGTSTMASSGFASVQYSNDAIGPDIVLYKSRSGTFGTTAGVSGSDNLGRLIWRAVNASGLHTTPASIECQMNSGTPSGSVLLADLVFKTGGGALSRAMTIHSSGVILAGPHTAPFSSAGGTVDVTGTTAATAAIQISNYQAGAGAPQIKFRHSRGATNAHGANSIGDGLGGLYFEGNDGSQFVKGAEIVVQTESVASSGFIDSSIRFTNFKAGQGYTEKLRIWPSGGIAAGTFAADPGFQSIQAAKFDVRQSGDGVGNGFLFNNAAGDCNAYFFLGGTSNPNAPRDVCIVPNYPGTGLTVWNAGDLTKMLASFRPAISGGCQLIGDSSGSSAAAGYVGEYVEGTQAGLALTAASPANVTSISLPAGDWDVAGHGNFQLTGSNLSFGVLSVSLTSATLDTDVRRNSQGSLTVASGLMDLAVPVVRFSLAATTTIYLVAQYQLSGVTVKGSLIARRRR